MKLQIDTKEKTIKVEGTVNLNELIESLDKLLPDEWKTYSLESGTIIQWYNPIHRYSYYPWRIGDQVTYCGTTQRLTGDVTISANHENVYNVEVSN